MYKVEIKIGSWDFDEDEVVVIETNDFEKAQIIQEFIDMQMSYGWAVDYQPIEYVEEDDEGYLYDEEADVWYWHDKEADVWYFYDEESDDWVEFDDTDEDEAEDAEDDEADEDDETDGDDAGNTYIFNITQATVEEK